MPGCRADRPKSARQLFLVDGHPQIPAPRAETRAARSDMILPEQIAFSFERTAMSIQPIMLALALTFCASLAHAEGASRSGSAAGRSERSAAMPFADDALRANGTRMPGPNAATRTSSQDSDARINTENRRLDNAVKSICRGC